MVMACLKYGQYFSQYDIRDIAVIDPVNKQSGGHWYSIGVNDQFTSEKVRLTSLEYPSGASTEDYIIWMKKLLRKGYAVTICVYMNHYLFYLETDPEAGYKEYDHIVTLRKIESDFDDDEYHESDIITIADHGLWSPRITGPPYYFSFVAKDFMGNREEANDPNGNIYTLPKREFTTRNYGIAQTGIYDEKSECLNVTLTTNVNNEDPQIAIHSEVRPTPMAINLVSCIH